MPTPSPIADPSATPTTAGSGTMETLYRAALGPVQLPRYLALFERYDRLSRAPAGWNPAASLATLNWMLLHHLWTAALIYVALVEGLALLIFGVGRPLLHWPEQVEWGLIAAFALFAIVLPGLFGDALLHSEIRKRVARALVAAQSIPDACAILARQASSWRRLKWIAAANLLLFVALALAWTLVPPNGWNRTPPAATDSGLVEKAVPALPIAALPAAEPLQPGGLGEPAEPAEPDAASSAFLTPSPATPAISPPEPAVDASAPAQPDAAAESPPTPEPEPTTPSAPTAVAPADTAATASQRRAGKQAAKPPASTSAAPVAAPAATPAPAHSAALPATPSSAAPAPETPARATASSTPAARPAARLGKAPGYYLNVGVFAEEANARRAQAKLLNANLPAFRQTFDTKNGERTRVRVGPFETAEKAQAAASRVRSLQLEAVMVRQRG